MKDISQENRSQSRDSNIGLICYKARVIKTIQSVSEIHCTTLRACSMHRNKERSV
jgi:hypothetical protein